MAVKKDSQKHVALVIVCLTAFLLTLSSLPVSSHGFYSQWKTADGMSCCNQSDCRPVEAIDMRFAEHGLEVRVEGEWVTVDPQHIRPYSAPDLSSHVCHIGKNILCFVFGGGA
jgi:hypothetical protein